MNHSHFFACSKNTVNWEQKGFLRQLKLCIEMLKKHKILTTLVRIRANFLRRVSTLLTRYTRFEKTKNSTNAFILYVLFSYSTKSRTVGVLINGPNFA